MSKEITTAIEHPHKSFRSILKSTSLIGGASVFNVLIGMVRTKFIAVLLGPSGVGLLAMYTNLTGIVTMASDMGLQQSGVRQVAKAVGTDDDEKIAATVITIRRLAWFTGSVGMGIMVIFCRPLSNLTFKNGGYAASVALLGTTIFFTAITTGQSCVLQGTRRISDIAKISVLGALNGTFISIPAYYLMGQNGIVVSLILSSLASLMTSWWYARKIKLCRIIMSWRSSLKEARHLLSLGLSFMGAGLVGLVSDYIIRVMLNQRFGLDGTGVYQAALSLSGVLVGFILAAMGADFYPRLTGVSNDDKKFCLVVKEQTEISLIIGLPCLAVMMVFAPLVIKLFYSASFAQAIELLRWFLLGALGKIISWPMNFSLLAKGRGRCFFIVALLTSLFHVIAVYLGIRFWGLFGAVIAYVALLILNTALMFIILHDTVSLMWSKITATIAFLSVTTLLFLIATSYFLRETSMQFLANYAFLAIICSVCLRELMIRTNITIQDLKDKLLVNAKRN